MAEMNFPRNRAAGQRFGKAALNAPRIVMSWEEWFTFFAALVTFMSVAVSIQQANWVREMPSVPTTAFCGLLLGMIAARFRAPAPILHAAAIVIGLAVVALVVQTYADGYTLTERLADFRFRMREWFDVVASGDISNDNLPFVTLVHGLTFVCMYLASWSLFRWRNPWFAIVPAGLLLLSNISFQRGHPAGAFIVFLFGGMLLIGRLHLQKRQDRWRAERVEFPEWIGLSAGQLTIVLTTALIIAAWMVPLGAQASAVSAVFDGVVSPFTGNESTFARLFHNVDSRKGANLHAFGDTLPIQGNVKLGTKLLLNVQSGQAGLLRATSYDNYTGTGWKITGRKEDRTSGRELATDENSTNYEARNVTILRVTVVDGDSTLVTLGTPLGTNIGATIESNKNFTSDIEQMRSRRGLQDTDTYNTFGTESTATAEQLRTGGTQYPDWVTARYLQLPGELPQRVRDEAARVAGGAATPYDKAVAIESYLREFPYDLDVESAPAKRDSVDFFLFDLKRGYFDYQSTSMAVMLRTLGIPARVTVGYVLNPDTVKDTTYEVHKNDAYSWVEVFVPKYGWVNFNPTQDRPAGGAGGLGSPDPALPFEDPSLQDLNPDAGGIVPTDLQAALNEKPVENSTPPWLLIWSLVGILAVAAVGTLSGRFAWNWGLGGMEPRTKLWAKTQRLAGWAGLGPKQHETPREWSRRVGPAVERPDAAAKLAEAYEEAKYGRPDLQRVDDADAASAYTRLRNALLTRVLRRKPAPPKLPRKR